MSQRADHCESLKFFLKKYPSIPEIVVDIWYDLITNQDWEVREIINMLKSGWGFSDEIDIVINKYIEQEKFYL